MLEVQDALKKFFQINVSPVLFARLQGAFLEINGEISAEPKGPFQKLLIPADIRLD